VWEPPPRLLTANDPHEILDKPQVAAAMHILTLFHLNGLLGVPVALVGIRLSDYKTAILHGALNFPFRTTDMNGSAGLGRAPDHVVCRDSSVIKFNHDRLMIDHVVITSPYTSTVGAVRFQIFNFLFIGWIDNMFNAAPHMRPIDIVADEVFPGGVVTGGFNLTISQTP